MLSSSFMALSYVEVIKSEKKKPTKDIKSKHLLQQGCWQPEQAMFWREKKSKQINGDIFHTQSKNNQGQLTPPPKVEMIVLHTLLTTPPNANHTVSAIP